MGLRRNTASVWLVAGFIVGGWLTPSHALEAIDFSLGASSAAAPSRTIADDDDEDAFFSSGAKTRYTGTTVATAGPLPHGTAMPRPSVDVVATCRAVLADNLNYYNYNFIEGCHRTVRQAGGR